MKLLIKTGRWDAAILVDSPNAAHAATLLAGATLVKSDGYGENERWSKADGGITIEFVDDLRVQEYTEREKALKKTLDDKQSEYYKKFNEADAANKRVKELEAQIALLQSVTVCTQNEPPVEPVEESGEEIIE